MADLSPAPSTMSELSFVTLTVLAVPSMSSGGVGERHAEVLVDDLGAGDDSDVLEDALATVAETRSLDGDHVDGAAQAC